MSLHPDFVNELRKQFTGDIRLDLSSKILDIFVIAIERNEIPEELPDMHIYNKITEKYPANQEAKQLVMEITKRQGS